MLLDALFRWKGAKIGFLSLLLYLVKTATQISRKMEINSRGYRKESGFESLSKKFWANLPLKHAHPTPQARFTTEASAARVTGVTDGS